MPNVTCFLLEPTDRARQVLRRYTYRGCPAAEFGHSAEVPIEDGPALLNDEGYTFSHDDWPRTDPRWPEVATCACGYRFQEDDGWAMDQRRIYQRADTGAEMILRDAPPGAIWDAEWIADLHWRGPDGRCLEMKLPDGSTWIIDGPATNGPGWQRTGVPPHITATPSILSTNYHGWLRDGVLVDA